MSSVNIVSNVALSDTDSGTQTSTRCEPTVAAAFDEVYTTGNWFASRSSDVGQNWTFVDPFTALTPAAGGFCCDQVALHQQSRNLWFWTLQYVASGGTNVFRVAISTNGRPESWTYWDWAPGTFKADWNGTAWFDYPDVAATNTHLYITYNVFNSNPQSFLASVVMRFKLDDMIAKGNLVPQYYIVEDHGSLRLTQGATTDMYFASHNTQNPIRVYHWGDGDADVMTWNDITPTAWNGATPYSSLGPGGAEWLGRVDPRITGAWTTGNQAGFFWTANSDATHPNPYVKGLVVNTTDWSIVSEPDIWHPDVAWAYPAACPNVNGVVGISLFRGGGTTHPVHTVGFLDSGSWVMAGTAVSTDGPANGFWGDYVSCQVHDPEQTDWVASGYTLQGGTDRQAIEPRYVRFNVGP